jgi:hypothetical protein
MGRHHMTAARGRVIGSCLALCLLGSAGAVAVFAPPAGASTGPAMAQTEPVLSSPGGSRIPGGEWSIAAGTPVTMICWTEGPNTDGSKKWFEVKSRNYPYSEGYVPANSVTHQVTVGLCR